MAATVAKTVIAKTEFTIICAWCDQILNDKPIALELPQTHTICKKCRVKVRQELTEIQLEKEAVLS